MGQSRHRGDGVEDVRARRRSGADSLALAQRVSTSRYDVHVDIPAVLFRAANRITDVRTGGSLTLYRPRWTHEIGYELSSDRTSYYANGPRAGFGDVIPFDSLEQRSRTASVYGDVLWRPTSSLIVDGGVRVDALDGGRGSIVEPAAVAQVFPDAGPGASSRRRAGMRSGCTRSGARRSWSSRFSSGCRARRRRRCRATPSSASSAG